MSDTDTTAPEPSTGESARGTVKGLVEEHPVAMLAGGILIGALVAGALSRPGPAKDPSEQKPRRSFGRRAVQLAAIGAELAAAYVARADSMAENAAEPAEMSGPTTPESAKSPTRRMSGLTTTALRTLGLFLTRQRDHQTLE